MANILSLQSHVAYGYVGNSAAVFPLQRLGHQVIVINTVQFSNHTGYGEWQGDIMPIAHIDNIFNGLAKLGALNQLDAVLTGYLGDPELGSIVLKWLAEIRRLNPKLTYCCDPVIGDTDRGIFVRPGIPEFFREQALSQASILTPNQFELSYLSGVEIKTLADARRACGILHQQGIHYILVTSLSREDAAPDQIEMLLTTNSEAYLVATPRLQMPIAPNGSGDMTTAIFLAKFLETRDPVVSLAHTSGAIYDIFAETQARQQRELAIIEAQLSLSRPNQLFKVTRL